MAFTESWIETDPDGAVITGSQLDDYQRQSKRALRERLEGDPAAPLTGIFEVGSFTAAPMPRAGTARVYNGTDATIRALAAGSRQDGRLGYATDTKRLYHVGAAAVVEVGYMSTSGPNTQTQASSRDPSFLVRDSAATALAANALFAANGTQVVTQSHNSNARFAAVSFAGPSQFIGYRGNGDSGATTQVVNGSTLASFQGRGYTSAPAWTTAGAGGLEVVATEAWTAGANGAKVIIFVTANGGTATTTVMTANADGTATFNSTVNATTFVGALTGNATTATTATSATTAGTVTTAAQPAITSVGTLTSLAVSGAFSSGAATVTTLAGTGAMSGFTTASFSSTVSQIGSTSAFFVLDTTTNATSDNNAIFFKRGGTIKWRIGNNIVGTNVDRLSIYNDALGNEAIGITNSTGAVSVTAALTVGGLIRNDAVSGGFAMGVVTSVPRIVYSAGATSFTFLTGGNGDAILSTGHLYAETDGVFDIGQNSSALRYRNLFLTGSATILGAFQGSQLSITGGGTSAASRVQLSFGDVAATGRLASFGANAATVGILNLVVASSDGSLGFTTTYSATGTWTFPARISATVVLASQNITAQRDGTGVFSTGGYIGVSDGAGNNTCAWQLNATNGMDGWVAAGTRFVTISSTGTVAFTNDTSVAAAKKLFVDGGGDTYIIEASANVMDHYVGATQAFRISVSGFEIGSGIMTSSAAAANAVWVVAGIGSRAATSTSSLKYKKDIVDLTYKEAANLVFGSRAIAYTSRILTDDQNRRHIGFIKEEIDKLDTRFGNGEGLAYERFTAPLTVIAQSHEKEIKSLQERIQKLEAQLLARS